KPLACPRRRKHSPLRCRRKNAHATSRGGRRPSLGRELTRDGHHPAARARRQDGGRREFDGGTTRRGSQEKTQANFGAAGYRPGESSLGCESSAKVTPIPVRVL